MEEQGGRGALQTFQVISNQEAESCDQILIGQGRRVQAKIVVHAPKHPQRA